MKDTALCPLDNKDTVEGLSVIEQLVCGIAAEC